MVIIFFKQKKEERNLTKHRRYHILNCFTTKREVNFSSEKFLYLKSILGKNMAKWNKWIL